MKVQTRFDNKCLGSAWDWTKPTNYVWAWAHQKIQKLKLSLTWFIIQAEIKLSIKLLSLKYNTNTLLSILSSLFGLEMWSQLPINLRLNKIWVYVSSPHQTYYQTHKLAYALLVFLSSLIVHDSIHELFSSSSLASTRLLNKPKIKAQACLLYKQKNKYEWIFYWVKPELFINNLVTTLFRITTTIIDRDGDRMKRWDCGRVEHREE